MQKSENPPHDSRIVRELLMHRYRVQVDDPSLYICTYFYTVEAFKTLTHTQNTHI